MWWLVVCLTFWGRANCFPRGCSIYIPTSRTHWLDFKCSLFSQIFENFSTNNSIVWLNCLILNNSHWTHASQEKKGTALRKLFNYADFIAEHLEQGHVLGNTHSFCTWGNRVPKGEITWEIKIKGYSTSWLLVELRLRLWSCNSAPIILFLILCTNSFFLSILFIFLFVYFLFFGEPNSQIMVFFFCSEIFLGKWWIYHLIRASFVYPFISY